MLGNFIKCLVRGFLFLVFRIKVIGAENLIDGGVIVAVNHRSNWDPVIMGAVSRRKLRFLAKSELFKNKLADVVLRAVGAFPIERGKGDIGAVKTSLKVLANGEPLLIFPEGTRTTDDSGERVKTGAVMIASHAHVPIVPVYISGKYSWMGKVTVNYGEPVDVTADIDGKPTREQMQSMADGVMAKIRALKV